jgi:hypothetical protein
LPRELLFELGQRQPGRRHKKHRIFGRLDHRCELRAMIAEHVEHGTLHVRRIKESDRGVGLRV